ncbi:hypothetical protein CVT26_012709, partial [Gymnopilus dilepis]
GRRVVGASSKLREAAGKGKGKGKGKGQGSVGKGREEADHEGDGELMFIPIIDAPPRRDSAWVEEMGPLALDHEGTFALASFFGGPPPAVKWFSRTFYLQHDYFLRMGYASAVSPSTSSTSSPSANTNAYANANTNAVFNSVLVSYPRRFITVWPRDPDAPVRLWGGGLLSSFLGSSLGVGLGAGGGGHLGACGSQGEGEVGEEGYVKWWLAGRAVRERWRAYWLGEGGGEGGGRLPVPGFGFLRILARSTTIRSDPPAPSGITLTDPGPDPDPDPPPSLQIQIQLQPSQEDSDRITQGTAFASAKHRPAHWHVKPAPNGDGLWCTPDFPSFVASGCFYQCLPTPSSAYPVGSFVAHPPIMCTPEARGCIS